MIFLHRNKKRKNAALAQLVEQPPCKRQVVGAEPTRGSTSEELEKWLAFLEVILSGASVQSTRGSIFYYRN